MNKILVFSLSAVAFMAGTASADQFTLSNSTEIASSPASGLVTKQILDQEGFLVKPPQQNNDSRFPESDWGWIPSLKIVSYCREDGANLLFQCQTASLPIATLEPPIPHQFFEEAFPSSLEFYDHGTGFIVSCRATNVVTFQCNIPPPNAMIGSWKMRPEQPSNYDDRFPVSRWSYNSDFTAVVYCRLDVRQRFYDCREAKFDHTNATLLRVDTGTKQVPSSLVFLDATAATLRVCAADMNLNITCQAASIARRAGQGQ